MLLVNLIEFNYLGTALKHPCPFLKIQRLPFLQGRSGSSFLNKSGGSGFYNLTRLETAGDAPNWVVDVREVDDGSDSRVLNKFRFRVPYLHEFGRGGFVSDEEIRLQKGDVVCGFEDSTEVFFVGSRLQEASDDMGQRVLVLVECQELIAKGFDDLGFCPLEDFCSVVSHMILLHLE